MIPMSFVNAELVSQYDLRLEKVQGALRGQDQAWVRILGNWRDELLHVSDQAALSAHAVRTARSMGGMESLGEVIMTKNDPEEMRLLEELHAMCKFILSS